MIVILSLILVMTFFILASAGVMQLFYKKEMAVEARVAGYFGKEVFTKDKAFPKDLSNKQSGLGTVKTYWEKIKDKLAGTMSRHAIKQLEFRLRDAGYPFNWTAIDFRLFQIISATVLFTGTFLLFGKMTTNFGALLLLSSTTAAIGIYYPNFYLSVRKKRRVHAIEKGIPDFFDMVNLTIEAGMGIDAAITKVCRTNKGPLADEFLQALEDMRLGKSRRQAFTELRNRIPLDMFQSLMTSIIQADQLGIGMAKVLKSLTVRVREHQREKAREQAMKAPVKMLFPMVLFIFPAIFIILLGPLVVRLIVHGLG